MYSTGKIRKVHFPHLSPMTGRDIWSLCRHRMQETRFEKGWTRALNAFGPFVTVQHWKRLGRLCVVYAQKAQKLGACGGLKKAERVPGTRLGRWWLSSEKNRRKHHTSGYDFILFPKTTVLFIHASCMISYHVCFHTLHVINSYHHDHTFILMPMISYFEQFHV